MTPATSTPVPVKQSSKPRRNQIIKSIRWVLLFVVALAVNELNAQTLNGQTPNVQTTNNKNENSDVRSERVLHRKSPMFRTLDWATLQQHINGVAGGAPSLQVQTAKSGPAKQTQASPTTSTPTNVERSLGSIVGAFSWNPSKPNGETERRPRPIRPKMAVSSDSESPAGARSPPQTDLHKDIETSLGSIAGGFSSSTHGRASQGASHEHPEPRLAERQALPKLRLPRTVRPNSTRLAATRIGPPQTDTAADFEDTLASIAGAMVSPDVTAKSQEPPGRRLARNPMFVKADPVAQSKVVSQPNDMNVALQNVPQHTSPLSEPRDVPIQTSTRVPAPRVPSSAHRQVSAINVPAPVAHGPHRGQLEAYRGRALELREPIRRRMQTESPRHNDPVAFDAWWSESISQSIGLSNQVLPVDVTSLVQSALASSPYVQAVLTEPQIRRREIVIADAEFDSTAFVEGKFTDTNEPVGSLLTTGNADDRYRDATLASSAGLRRKTRRGGSLELTQRGGYQDNNSTFLFPNSQATTRLELNFTQPLMKDRGRAVNNTRILLAQIDLKLATNEVRANLENHLIDVTRAYWDLFQARAEWMQRDRLLGRAQLLYDILNARGHVDTQRRQILRAKVAVTSRRSDLIRTETRIRNSQARLRLLTGDPQLIDSSQWELTPQDHPLAFPVELSTRDATLTALENRPDITKSLRTIQAVSARVGAARNQILPRLDLILSSYLSGLDSQTNVPGAWANQFGDGRPSYAAGLLYEIPLGNRASRARLARNRLELKKSILEFRQATELAFADVEVAVRETRTAYDEMIAKKDAIEASIQEVEYLEDRWKFLPDPSESTILLIENLLDAQQRLADEEREYTSAQVGYAMSWVQLRKSMGVLLRFDAPSHVPFVGNNDVRVPAEVSVPEIDREIDAEMDAEIDAVSR